MTEHPQSTSVLLARFEPPSPPDALRDLVLRRAGAALDRPAVLDGWRWIHSNPLLRAAWGVSVLGLVVANVLLARTNRRAHERWFMEETARRTPEIRQVVAVPRLYDVYVSMDAFAYRPRVVTTPVRTGSVRKENSL